MNLNPFCLLPKNNLEIIEALKEKHKNDLYVMQHSALFFILILFKSLVMPCITEV